MRRIEKANIKIGTGIMETFTRMSVETDQLLREFIDNSTTSYYDHADELNKVVEEKKCIVNIEWDDSRIIIEDNSYGMIREEFLRALRPHAKADSYSEKSRGKYGMGLKYAALNLGSKYSIESTAFGSTELYNSTIDLEELKKDIEEVPFSISETLTSRHYTKITITNLARSLKEYSKSATKKNAKSKEESLRSALSQIYSFDITHGYLDIFLNGKKIVYYEPELLQRPDGGEFFSTFADSFEFGGKEYSYHGWIAILKTGSISNAGFNLIQKDRAIQLNYRPEDLFGKSNDFRYQRVIGEISLDGDSWIVTFAKDDVKWDDFGLEDTFIQSLNDNREIASIFRYAKDYRKNKENVTNETVKKWVPDLKETFSSISTDEKKGTPKEDNSNQIIRPKEQIEPIGDEKTENKQDEFVKLPVSYAGIDYIFEIVPADSVLQGTPWIKTYVSNGEKNIYRIEINVRSPFFEEFKDQKSKKLITKMALCVALAQLSCKRSGLSIADSQKFVEELNNILNSFGKGE